MNKACSYKDNRVCIKLHWTCANEIMLGGEKDTTL